MLRTAFAATLGLALMAAPAFVTAQPAAGAARPAPAMASKDPKTAPAGNYKLDEKHIGVIARVPHMNGTSYSVFRFDKVHGMLTWDPANEAATKITVTVEPGSIATNVDGFAASLSGDRFLKASTFPEATFVSTGVRMVSPTHAMVDGNLTLMGQTHPAVIDTELVGVGNGQGGKKNMGFMGKMMIKRSDFGFSAMVGPIGDQIEVSLDGEFDGQ